MEAKGWKMLNVLMNHYHQGPKEALLHFLPEGDRSAAVANETSSHDTSPMTTSCLDSLGKIHYSWLVACVEQLPDRLQELILAALPPEQASPLLTKLHRQRPPQTLCSPVAAFLLTAFYRDFVAKEVDPPALLAQTSLSFLGHFNKQQLVELIDLLGVYDLCYNIRQLIDKSELSRLMLSLTPLMQQFVRVCLHERDWLSPYPLPLASWDGKPKTLLHLIHRRGLIRLGKALSGHPPGLIHYISHVLDTGRGKIVLDHYTTEPVADVSTNLETQVAQVVKFLRENR